jgi:hypothetical protein
MRLSVLLVLLAGLASGMAAMAQTVDQRALIGRLQQGNTPCNPAAVDRASQENCSRRAVAREVGRQQGYCWLEPRSASNNGPIMRCDPNKRQP